jgi:hypothetical protein
MAPNALVVEYSFALGLLIIEENRVLRISRALLNIISV